MQFVNPIWLWALTGLSVPIGIHLLSRKEGKVIRIGSLRHLQETNTQQFKGIRLNEIVLLSLRCLLIILFVLLISGLGLHSRKGSQAPWVLVENGLQNTPEAKSQIDNFQKQGYEVRLLTSGFPFLADSILESSFILYGKLVEELQTEKFSEAIVFSKNRMEGFNGKRMALPSNIRWISVASEPADYTLSAIVMDDSIAVRSGHTSAEKTYFTTQKLPVSEWKESERESMDTVQVTIVADKAYQYDQKIIVAALKAINQSVQVNLEIINSTSEKINVTGAGDWFILLTDKVVLDSIHSKIIYLNPQATNDILVQEKPTRWAITKRLNEEIALSENLAIQLASVLIPSKKYWEAASQHDGRMFPDERAWSKNSDEKELASLSMQSAESYLLALLLITLLIERVLAYHRNQ